MGKFKQHLIEQDAWESGINYDRQKAANSVEAKRLRESYEKHPVGTLEHNGKIYHPASGQKIHPTRGRIWQYYTHESGKGGTWEKHIWADKSGKVVNKNTVSNSREH